MTKNRPDYRDQDFADALFRAAAGQHQLVSATQTLELDIHTYPQNLPLGASAGMGFFQFHMIVQMQIHMLSSCQSAGARRIG